MRELPPFHKVRRNHAITPEHNGSIKRAVPFPGGGATALLSTEYRVSHDLRTGHGTAHHDLQVEEAQEHEKLLAQLHTGSEKTLVEQHTIDYHKGHKSSLRCVLQRTRPTHASGQPDTLPFKDAASVRHIFREIALPSSYFEIADGGPGSIHSHIFADQRGHKQRFELVAHCVTRQGDWAMALSHSASTGTTSVFWSLEARIDSKRLSDDMLANSHQAIHPMLVPCIMFAGTFRMAVDRRHTLKSRFRSLEESLAHITRRASFTRGQSAHGDDVLNDTRDFDSLFAILHSCRRDQSSRQGRYNFWQSFHKAIAEGFEYFESILADSPDELSFQTHSELKQWFEITWQRLQSLMFRDKDHIDRVDNLSRTLYNLVQQREIRLQSSIARAAQRDSEGMKYIAVLGSIFLPANLIATILNVPQFQFAQGATLFGAYMGITIPFSAIVVFLCLSRPFWMKWRTKKVKSQLEDANLLTCDLTSRR